MSRAWWWGLGRRPDISLVCCERCGRPFSALAEEIIFTANIAPGTRFYCGPCGAEREIEKATK